MVAVGVSHRKCLALVQYVVTLEREGETLLEEKFGYFGIEYTFRSLFGSIAPIPVVAAVCIDSHASRYGPEHFSLYLVRPGDCLAGILEGVPRLVEPHSATDTRLHEIVAVGELQPFHKCEVGIAVGYEPVRKVLAVVGGKEIPVEAVVVELCRGSVVVAGGKFGALFAPSRI